jgi:hypothetical protein
VSPPPLIPFLLSFNRLLGDFEVWICFRGLAVASDRDAGFALLLAITFMLCAFLRSTNLFRTVFGDARTKAAASSVLTCVAGVSLEVNSNNLQLTLTVFIVLFMTATINSSSVKVTRGAIATLMKGIGMSERVNTILVQAYNSES